ncbi:glutaredoxin family protein [Prochlorococcus marinus]|uniref:Glutaredoxin family protein n=1 Tax=Prochlorococcus marinus XMU1408 TaxID=2213228 RepID=A0A318R4I9_PROMR|nr:glutaredoxin family protein [Prochlorococcus marinus]MBW3041439.1 glutaredoxin family protein [Prochlorococcus marinus str. XMU1408]PYE02602.1 glutaredoxin family protein [Prochlorococcus marinus XMU1408]
MNSEVFILLSRKGCCLCETLEKKMLNISLTNLNPPIVLSIIDIDSKEVPYDIKKKYTNDVPVIILESSKLSRKIELPRIPPRLKDELLLSWLQKKLNIYFEKY